MEADRSTSQISRVQGFGASPPPSRTVAGRSAGRRPQPIEQLLNRWIESLAPSPWGAHAGISPWDAHLAAVAAPHQMLTSTAKTPRAPLYTPAQRVRRDNSRWTLVQGVLAPLQFAICTASLLLIVRYLATGEGYALATGSILLKTVALYAIMITGSIWEKEVFGRWLFAPAFFWEDVVSMVVLALQTAYVACLVMGWGTPAGQMTLAIAAYGAYAVNASQFLMKLRAARLGDAAASRSLATARVG